MAKSDPTSADIQALTASINALNETIVNTFTFDLETFAYIDGQALLIFIGAFWLGVIVKRFKQT